MRIYTTFRLQNSTGRGKNNKMLEQVRNHIMIWSHQKLSLAGRLLVANQAILASIWYITSCANISSKLFKQAKALVRYYVGVVSRINKLELK